LAGPRLATEALELRERFGMVAAPSQPEDVQVTLRDQIAELGLEIAARLSSQERAVANARSATTALSRARVERDSVELFLAALDEPDRGHDDRQASRASGT
jgi:hypothetical protein